MKEDFVVSNHKIAAPPVLSTSGDGDDQTLTSVEYLNSYFIDNQILSDIFSEYLFIVFNQPSKIKDELI
jgi:hypothetical protein